MSVLSVFLIRKVFMFEIVLVDLIVLIVVVCCGLW